MQTKSSLKNQKKKKKQKQKQTNEILFLILHSKKLPACHIFLMSYTRI